VGEVATIYNLILSNLAIKNVKRQNVSLHISGYLIEPTMYRNVAFFLLKNRIFVISFKIIFELFVTQEFKDFAQISNTAEFRTEKRRGYIHPTVKALIHCMRKRTDRRTDGHSKYPGGYGVCT
jgi:hypothetical protein